MGGSRPNRQIIEAASWRVACELCRRHPELRIVEPHRGAGGDDVLAVVRHDSIDLLPGIVLDRAGGVSLLRFDTYAADAQPDFWTDYVAGDPKAMLRTLEARAGLRRPATMPASTPAMLAYRVLAAIAASAVFGIRRIEIRAAITRSAVGHSLRAGLFAAFPAMWTPLPPEGIPHLDTWFVCIDGAPHIAVDASAGTVWRLGRPAGDLMELYSGLDRRLAPVVAHVAQEVLA